MTSPAPLLSVRGLCRRYARRRRWLARPEWIAAVADVSFDVEEASILGIVGASGSGKSTLVRCAALLETPDAGQVLWSGAPVTGGDSLAAFRRRVQLVFQDSATAFNPRFTALDIITEPLRIQNLATPAERRERALALMRDVGLSPDWADRHPSQFSGGQRQRLAIARALALEPRLIFLDEALSGLDLSTQAQIANLLLDLQQQRRLAYVLVSHDISLVSRLAGRLMVMCQGRVVQEGATAAVLDAPHHPETVRLVSTSAALASRVRRMAAGAR